MVFSSLFMNCLGSPYFQEHYLVLSLKKNMSPYSPELNLMPTVEQIISNKFAMYALNTMCFHKYPQVSILLLTSEGWLSQYY